MTKEYFGPDGDATTPGFFYRCGMSHHLACDCREAKFKKLIHAAKNMLLVLDNNEILRDDLIFKKFLDLNKAIEGLEK
jgi:hypothetical protein